jgi:ParB family chromosome partitioning protein
MPQPLEFRDIPFSQLISDFTQTPGQLENLAELVESIKAIGLLQPIVVARRPDDMFQLIAGRRRVMAALLLQASFIKAVVLDSLPEPSIAGAIWASENLVRRTPPPADLIAVFQALLTQFGSPGAIAEQTGIPVGDIQIYLQHQT